MSYIDGLGTRVLYKPYPPLDYDEISIRKEESDDSKLIGFWRRGDLVEAVRFYDVDIRYLDKMLNTAYDEHLINGEASSNMLKFLKNLRNLLCGNEEEK